MQETLQERKLFIEKNRASFGVYLAEILEANFDEGMIETNMPKIENIKRNVNNFSERLHSELDNNVVSDPATVDELRKLVHIADHLLNDISNSINRIHTRQSHSP